MAPDVSLKRIQTSGELFKTVQKNRVFPDSKQFVDMVPTEAPEAILKKWNDQKNDPDFELKEFIENHFRLPDSTGDTIDINQKDNCRVHIQELWPMLFRPADVNTPPHSSLIPLPHPYVVPGGRFREIYYWDSYFTARGLIADGHRDMALNMTRNFQYMIKTHGHIPNGNRVYYLSRSQPPFFIPMISMIADEFGADIIADFFDEAILEYRFWMDKTRDDKDNRRAVIFTDTGGDQHQLNRYWDDNPSPREESYIEDVKEFEESGLENDTLFYRHIRAACESGWDFSSRWLADMSNLASIETTNILPIDLNTLLWYAENRLAKWSDILGHPKQAATFQQLADKRKSSINQLMWDSGRSSFFDYHIHRQQMTDTYSLAAVYPLYFKLADPAQAKAVAKTLENKLLKDGGLLTTTSETAQQWDAPNGWAPLQWMAVIGLENYGHSALANEIRTRWLRLNEQVYSETGKMVEKYNVSDIHKKGGGGEYPLQDGFGWTNGVFSALSDKS